MNTLSATIMADPYGKESECIQFTIDDISSPFVFSDIMAIDRQYTFSLWLMSDSTASLTVAGNAFVANNAWDKHFVTFTANGTDLFLIFDVPGIYYIYHPHLEFGNKPTDWTPAPEDVASARDLEATNENVHIVYESASELAISSDALKASVESTKIKVDNLTGEVEATKSEMASMKLAADELKLGFQEIENNGVTKVTTETGFTFDREGMTVDSTESPTKTQVTPDGMTVYKKDADGWQEEVLEATSDGVDATNLHAKTYLIIGGRSRFENYGADRTGCFWIGG